MLTKDAVEYFGSKSKIREILGYGNSAVYHWGEVVPESSAGRLYVLSNHRIPYRTEDYQNQESDKAEA